MKSAKMPVFKPLLLVLFLFTAGFLTAQEGYYAHFTQRYENAGMLFNQGSFEKAVAEFRGAQEAALNLDQWAKALYWVILSELAIADYGSAIRDMDDLDKYAPTSRFASDMVYHRGRAYFNQGYFEDALALFKRFNDNISSADTQLSERKAASFFWMGECLYFMGQFDEAERFYSWVITQYQNSPKFDLSTYRIDLIKQKKIEAELLALLRWSHEESLRTSEDYQRKLRTYEHTLNSYQRRINELAPPAAETSSLKTEDAPNLPPPVSGGRENNDNKKLSEDLIDKARRLEQNIQQLINDHEVGSGGLR